MSEIQSFPIRFPKIKISMQQFLHFESIVPIQSHSNNLRIPIILVKRQLLLSPYSRLTSSQFQRNDPRSPRRSSIIRSKPKTVFSAILNSRGYDAIARSYFQGRVGCQRSNREICVKTQLVQTKHPSGTLPSKNFLDRIS